MTWQRVVGHDEIISRFQTAARAERLAGTFLFVGPAGIGKRTFALQLAQALLCDRCPAGELVACGQCSACVQVQARTHPDLDVVCRPPDKNVLPLELFIGDDEHRMRAGLCYNLALKPFFGKRRIAIIDDADYLNAEAANCLLKTLEEPPLQAVMILIGTSEQRQLPTIRSRCRIVRFRSLSAENLRRVLREQNLLTDPADEQRAVALGRGSVQVALRWLEPALAEFREYLLEQLAKREWTHGEFAKNVIAFAEGAGTESAAKRQRLHEALSVAEDFYRELLRLLAGERTDSTADPALETAALTAAKWWSRDAETAAACVERTLDAHGHVDANAATVNVVECWLDDLATLTRDGVLAVWE